MKTYIILYDDVEFYKVEALNEVSAMVEMFELFKTQCVWNKDELYELGMKYGLEKIVKIFEDYETSIIDGIYEVKEIYEYGVDDE